MSQSLRQLGIFNVDVSQIGFSRIHAEHQERQKDFFVNPTQDNLQTLIESEERKLMSYFNQDPESRRDNRAEIATVYFNLRPDSQSNLARRKMVQ